MLVLLCKSYVCRFAGLNGAVLDEFRKSFVDDRWALGEQMASEYKLNLVKKMKVLAAFKMLNKLTPSLDATPHPIPTSFYQDNK